jgi:YD repeat-containing protein
LGRILQFEYDTLNHLTAEKWLSGTTLVRTLSFAYDAADQLLSASDPAALFSYGYDALGRLTNEGADKRGQA